MQEREMSEVKPTAYIYEDHVFKTEKEAILFKKEFDRYKHDGLLKHVILPLFTADNIADMYRQENRIKMTQAVFDEFNEMFIRHKSISGALIAIYNTKLYGKLQHFLIDDVDVEKKEYDFVKMFHSYNPDKPEETIEIVPDMKWFVVRKLPNTGGNMLKCSEDGLLMYNAIKEAATHFDTEEEAEQWTNPLTKAVQLPLD